METDSSRHVAQAIETPIIKSSGRGLEQAPNVPAGKLAKLVGGDPAGRTE